MFFRIKIMQNIGIAFVKIGQFSDAITSFEHIMSDKGNFQTGKLLNMQGCLVCTLNFLAQFLKAWLP